MWSATIGSYYWPPGLAPAHLSEHGNVPTGDDDAVRPLCTKGICGNDCISLVQQQLASIHMMGIYMDITLRLLLSLLPLWVFNQCSNTRRLNQNTVSWAWAGPLRETSMAENRAGASAARKWISSVPMCQCHRCTRRRRLPYIVNLHKGLLAKYPYVHVPACMHVFVFIVCTFRATAR